MGKKFKDTEYGDLTGKTYTGDLDLDKEKITSLEGCPKKVIGMFSLAFSKLASLEGCPQEVTGDCYLSSIDKLNSLKGTLRTIGGRLFIYSTNFTSIDHLKREIYTNDITIGGMVISDFGKFDLTEEEAQHYENQKKMGKFKDLLKFKEV